MDLVFSAACNRSNNGRAIRANSQGSLILVLFSFYPDVTNKTKGVGLKYFCNPHTNTPVQDARVPCKFGVLRSF